MSTAVAEDAKTETKTSQLDPLKKLTRVVADTGDFESIRDFKPQDATTNPSLIFRRDASPSNTRISWRKCSRIARQRPSGAAQIEDIIDHLLVPFGFEILQIVPGRVSTETDARLSFDTEGSIAKARQLIELYEAGRHRPQTRPDQDRLDLGGHQSRRGAAEGRHQLQPDAALLAHPGGRVRRGQGATHLALCRPHSRLVEGLDEDGICRAEDPGVESSVTQIFNYYKKFDYNTEVMGASFRNDGEFTELAGCDLLTISPTLLGELVASTDPIEKKLDAAAAKALDPRESRAR